MSFVTKRPDLPLADVMMPRIDGIEFLRAIRADPMIYLSYCYNKTPPRAADRSALMTALSLKT
jgi:CheY-like chemotaxis protein